MMNFYRRFLPHAAAIQAPLHDALSGTSVKDYQSITRTPELHRALDDCKVSLSCPTLLAHPNPAVPLALIIDASTSAMGAVLQQRVDNAWQPIAIFSMKLNSAQQKYSAYDLELLAVYEAVKHFRHSHFTIFTDHKPKRDKCSPRQFNHLDFIAQFTTNISHLSGQDIVVTDALSCRICHCATTPQHASCIAVLLTTNFEHFWRQIPPYDLRSKKLPTIPSPATVTRLPESLDRTFPVLYASKSSRPSTMYCS
jgi:hypothetical protein